jgi:peptidoglycan/xylan/chitin deacetylase (PgdA/CDA1 family)
MRVALTFDAEHPDRPNHGAGTPAVLEALERLDLRATFFLQGRWVEAEPGLARRVRDAGHLIGNHSHYHARMPLFSPNGFENDVRSAEAVIVETLDVDPRPWLRFPFGVGADDAALIERLAGLGYRHIGWHVEVYEWQPGRTPDEVVRGVVDGVTAHGDGAIVLLHPWPDPVAPALPEIVPALHHAGFTFVRLDQLDLDPGLAPVADPQPAMIAG